MSKVDRMSSGIYRSTFRILRFLRLLNLSDAYIDMEVIMGHFFW